jgi:hypothetical protein
MPRPSCPYSPSAWKSNSTQYAVAISLGDGSLNPYSTPHVGVKAQPVVHLAAFVAWIRCKPLRLDTAELPENFRNHS